MRVTKDELEQVYLNTVYSVFVNGHEYQIKPGEKDSDDIGTLFAKTKCHSGVIMTAWNPRSQLLSLAENQKRNAGLTAQLIKNKIKFYDALGKGQDDSWEAEESFFIINISKERAESLALEHQQNAYIWLDENKPASLVFSAVWHAS